MEDKWERRGEGGEGRRGSEEGGKKEEVKGMKGMDGGRYSPSLSPQDKFQSQLLHFQGTYSKNRATDRQTDGRERKEGGR